MQATEAMKKVVMDEPRVLEWMLCDHAGNTAASLSCQQNGFSRTVDWDWHRERDDVNSWFVPSHPGTLW